MIKRLNESTGSEFIEPVNADDLIRELAELSMNWDKEHGYGCDYDIYLYIDENGVGELYEYPNAGGNSWLDDDHYTVTRFKYVPTDWSDCFQEISDIADALGMTREQLLADTLRYHMEQDPEWYEDYTPDDMEYRDVRDFVNAEFIDEIEAVYQECVDDQYAEYMEQAQNTWYDFVAHQRGDERYW